MNLRITVMHDYGCEPLWVSRDGHLREPEMAQVHGLSRSLAGRLQAWRLWGDSRVNIADPLDSRVVTGDEEAAYDAEGRLLAERVREELPHATVSYWKDGPAYQE